MTGRFAGWDEVYAYHSNTCVLDDRVMVPYIPAAPAEFHVPHGEVLADEELLPSQRRARMRARR